MLKCLDCDRYEYPLSLDLKCRACESRASTQMLALVMLAMLAAGVCGAWLGVAW